MRLIGHIGEKSEAKVFTDYLYAKGIENEFEEAQEGWAVWIHDDDEVKGAAKELEAFRLNPSDPKYLKGAEAGRRVWKEQAEAEKKTRRKVVDVRTTWGRGDVGGLSDGFLTIGLTVISIGVYVIAAFMPQISLRQILFMTDPEAFWAIVSQPGASIPLIPPDIASGQLWRLITPIFLHFGILHIVFNMLWLRDLGGIVESHHGTAFFAAFVFVLAVVPNFAQYYWSGPTFGGMSGVVYGLLGFVWIRGTYDRRVQYRLPMQIVVMMLIWFVVCLTGLAGPIANAAHAAGLVLGVIAGFLTNGRFLKD